MKNLLYTVLFFSLFLLIPIRSWAQKTAIFSYPVEMELSNDQGDMSTKEYLKNYGTKGKKRGNEYIYESVTPFLIKKLGTAGIELLAVDTLSSIKANDYGKPSTTLAKAVASGIADQYIKIYLKDITLPIVEGLTQQNPNSQSKKLIKIRCRIQLYDSKKTLLKEAEGIFQSGEKMESAAELGVDLRKYQGSEYLQELKIYETCTKMAVIKAVSQLSE
jgi:hypothetical protein